MMRLRSGALLPFLLFAMVSAATPSADARGLILRGESLRLGAIGPTVALPDGRLIDTRGLVVGPSVPAYADGDLLVHDLGSGRTQVATGDLGLRPLVSLEGAGSAQIGSLLATPGSVLLYESLDRGRTSLADASRFTHLDPPTGGGIYLADPAGPVPEPVSSIALTIGGLLLLGAARVGRRRTARARRSRLPTAGGVTA
ncbi:MAG: hypothetical protein R3F35_21045 [Myxococcota bacterium]